jgi:hypothetical protein
MCWYLKKNSILAVILIVFFTTLGHLESPSFSIFLMIIYSFLFGAIPNSIFLSVICLLNTDYKIFFTLPFMIFEVISLYFIGQIIEKTIKYIPEQYRFETTSSYTSIRTYFTFPYILFYQYLILFVVLYIFKYVYLKSKHKQQN